MTQPAHLVLYRKPGCCLCEGLEEKLAAIQDPPFELERRDITTNPEWLVAFQYEVPILFRREADGRETSLGRPAPRLSTERVADWLRSHL